MHRSNLLLHRFQARICGLILGLRKQPIHRLAELLDYKISRHAAHDPEHIARAQPNLEAIVVYTGERVLPKWLMLISP
jgi:hypothetical protein